MSVRDGSHEGLCHFPLSIEPVGAGPVAGGGAVAGPASADR